MAYEKVKFRITEDGRVERENIVFYKSWAESLMKFAPDDMKEAVKLIYECGFNGDYSALNNTDNIAIYTLLVNAIPVMQANNERLINANKPKEKSGASKNKKQCLSKDKSGASDNSDVCLSNTKAYVYEDVNEDVNEYEEGEEDEIKNFYKLCGVNIPRNLSFTELQFQPLINHYDCIDDLESDLKLVSERKLIDSKFYKNQFNNNDLNALRQMMKENKRGDI